MHFNIVKCRVFL